MQLQISINPFNRKAFKFSIRYLPGFCLGLLFILLPFVYGGNGDDMTALTGTTVVSFIGCLYCLFCSNTTTRNIRTSDIWIGIYVLYTLTNSLFHRHEDISFVWYYRWSGVIVCYFLIRNLNNPVRWLPFFAIAGLVQATLSLLQVNNFIESNHSEFLLTGSFGNPGQAGGFLAICFVLSLGLPALFPTKKEKVYFFLWGILVIIQGYVLILTDSRASWIATISGSIYIINQYKTFSLFHCASRLKFCLLIIFIGLCITGYYYKKDSADGRLLIWRVSNDMIAENLLLGQGGGAFQANYTLYQSEYFKKHPDSPYRILAGQPAYPYNEFIHIFIEQGFIGLILFIGFVTHLWFNLSSPKKYIYKGGLIALLILSLFSYPVNVFPILFFFAIFAGICRSKPMYSFNPSFQIKYFLIAILLVMTFLSIQALKKYQRMKQELPLLFTNQSIPHQKALLFLKSNYASFQKIPVFIDIYSRWAYDSLPPGKSLTILKNAAKIIPTVEVFCDLGNIYKSMGNIQAAEYYFLTASNMIPHRLTALYQLFLLYQATNQEEHALFVAKQILINEIKIENTETLRMKGVVQKYLETRDF